MHKTTTTKYTTINQTTSVKDKLKSTTTRQTDQWSLSRQWNHNYWIESWHVKQINNSANFPGDVTYPLRPGDSQKGFSALSFQPTQTED